jgi:hypothetical protein
MIAMKFSLYPDEWWPVLTLSHYEECEECEVEFSTDEIADLRRVEREFAAWQKKLGERFDEDSKQFVLVYDGSQP